MRKRYSLFAAALALATPLAWAAPVAKQGKACHLAGAEETLRCLKVAVPLDHGKPDGAKLDLHVTIAPAFRESARPDPLFVLAGGPGQAGSDIVSVLGAAFRSVRATRDVVLIDQRGTGLSGKLDCAQLPNEEQLSDSEVEAELMKCLQSIQRPLHTYTTEQAARDIEAVRKQLGYQQINIWGGSYGTRLGQAYARAFPAQVRSLVLDGVAAPNQVIPAGGKDAQAALDKLFAQCAADKECARAYPNLKEEFAALLARTATPVKVELQDPRTAQPRTLMVSQRRVIGTVQNILYSPQDNRRLPFLIHSAYNGRWAPFIARSNVGFDVGGDSALATVLHLAVTCSEDVPFLTPELVAEDGAQSFFGPSQITRTRPFCSALKVAAPARLAVTPIAAPVLMLSGALDPVTPPRRADEAARAMSKVQHLVADNAGHGVSHLGCAPRLVREFLDNPDARIDGACLKRIPAPPFQTGSAGPKP